MTRLRSTTLPLAVGHGQLWMRATTMMAEVRALGPMEDHPHRPMTPRASHRPCRLHRPDHSTLRRTR
jgi:hypothetical protein